MFSFTNAEIIEALNDTSNKPDMKIRLFLRATTENIENANKLTQASTGKVEIKYTRRFMHRKLAVFDSNYVWIGSSNWSEKGLDSNSEVDLCVNDPELADEATKQFNIDWQYPETGKPEGEEKIESYYIGSINTKKFHRPDCSFAKRIKVEYQKRFDTREQAIAQKYTPCDTCKP